MAAGAVSTGAGCFEGGRQATSPIVVAVALAGLLLAGIEPAAAARRQATDPPKLACPPRTSPANGTSYAGRSFVGTWSNFSGQDLTNADFSNAVLQAAVFVRANLSGANFSGATFVDSGDPMLPTDFTLANLSGACFIGAKFEAPVVFSLANLDRADFSQTDLVSPAVGKAVFGPGAPRFTPAPPGQPLPPEQRTRFRYTTLSCEFFAQWPLLDLTGAIVGACASRLTPGIDLSGAVVDGIDFSQPTPPLNLSNSKWQGASLNDAIFDRVTLDGATGLAGVSMAGASFNGASLQNVDMSNATLWNAVFINANLSQASLAGARLGANAAKNYPAAAKFGGAHLVNANLAAADLTGATFGQASFYSKGLGTPNLPCTVPDANGQCSAAPRTGFTCSCATASGATLTGTDFGGAYLAGVDFSGRSTQVNGAIFSGAVLVGASFAGAGFNVDNLGQPLLFDNTYVQGVDFGISGAAPNMTLRGAFLDFGSGSGTAGGNSLFLVLPGEYTKFKGWTGGATPCVKAEYAKPTQLPPNAPGLICPNGQNPVNGCGAPSKVPPLNPNWSSGVPIAEATLPGWYFRAATYDKPPADPQQTCNGRGRTPDPAW